jgi:hypothetical protein
MMFFCTALLPLTNQQRALLLCVYVTARSRRGQHRSRAGLCQHAQAARDAAPGTHTCGAVHVHHVHGFLHCTAALHKDDVLCCCVAQLARAKPRGGCTLPTCSSPSQNMVLHLINTCDASHAHHVQYEYFCTAPLHLTNLTCSAAVCLRSRRGQHCGWAGLCQHAQAGT